MHEGDKVVGEDATRVSVTMHDYSEGASREVKVRST